MDRAWQEAVVAACEPVFKAAGAGFWEGSIEGPEALLWEADPPAFLARYPDSRVDESYGDQWPAPCLDYWVYLRPDERAVELCLEGWNLTSEVHPVTGDAAVDGPALARRFAEVLRVSPPGPAAPAG